MSHQILVKRRYKSWLVQIILDLHLWYSCIALYKSQNKLLNHFCNNIVDISLVSKHYSSCHSGNSSSDKEYWCSQCSRAFKSLSNAKIHYNEVHLRIQPFKCSDCSKLFSRQSNLNRHYIIHHSKKHLPNRRQTWLNTFQKPRSRICCGQHLI